MSDRFTPSDDELRLLTEHLCYEVQMTFDLAMLLASLQVPRRPLMHNAMVESFPMHVRQLTDFFWKGRSSNPKAERDAFASDYFGHGEWTALRPECPPELDAVWEKVGWGIVHLTYGRANVTPQEKEWRPLLICQALAPAVRCFIDNVDPAKMDPEWFDPMRQCIDRFSAFERRHAGAAA